MTTLARLSIRVPAEQQSGFEQAYEHKLAPLLKQYGLVVSVDGQRPIDNGIFSRFFEAATPAGVHRVRESLEGDTTWQQAVQQLIGPSETASSSYQFGLHHTPAGLGRTVAAGSGQRVEAGSGTAAPVGLGLPQGEWHTFTVEDGLPNTIKVLHQDRQGTVWMGAGGSDNGLWSFDGSQIRHLTEADGLPDHWVNCLLEDRAGDLWIGTAAGLSRYDRATFTTFTVADGLADNVVEALLEDRAGDLWIGTAAGLSRYDGATFTTFTAADGLAIQTVECMAEDSAGRLWLGQGHGQEESGGLSRYDGHTFTTFTTADGLSDNRVYSLLVDRSGQLWVGHSNGVSRWDGQRFTLVFEAEGLVQSMVEDPMGRVWVGCLGELRCCADETYESVSLQGASVAPIKSLLVDQSGQLWVGPVGGALMRYSGHAKSAFTETDGLPGMSVWDLQEDRQGRLWISTHKGVCYYDGEHFVPLEASMGLFWGLMLQDRKGQIWFGRSCCRESEVGFWDGQRFERIPLPLLGGTTPLLEDRSGVLWFSARGVGGGLCQYDGRHWTTFTDDIGQEHNQVMCMLEDRQGRLWFGGEGSGRGGGLSRWDGRKVVRFTTDNGLVDDFVGNLLEDRDGRLWVATQGGLSCYDGRTFTNFTTDSGLVCNNLRRLMQDRAGHLWITSLGGGVARYDGRVFQHLTRRDGLAHDAVHPVFEDRHGAIWIGTDHGLNRYRPQSIPPKIQLQTISADRLYDGTESICIPTSQQLIVFEFQGQSLTTSPERMAYIYRLEGSGADWQAAYSGRAAYQNLPQGNYCFQVQAVDRDLNYSSIAQVQVTVEADALVETLTAALQQSGPGGDLVGTSAALRQVQAQLVQLAPNELTVLILGETGTGKGLVARTLHELSPRREKPFVSVNCGAMPEELIESELFGHERGAFSGAYARRLGKVELAQTGTLFLDEIGDMPLSAQVKLLRLLEERQFERLGGNEVFDAQVRVVAATNRDLPQMMRAGTFRSDLYFRLQGFELHLPPLRQRQEDIPLLALYFIGPMATHIGKPVKALSKTAEAAIVEYDWPGNVRELQHTIERAVIICQGPTIEVDDLAFGVKPNQHATASERVTLAEYERRYIQAVLEDTEGRISGPKGAAMILGLNEGTLRSRMKRLGIKRFQARNITTS